MLGSRPRAYGPIGLALLAASLLSCGDRGEPGIPIEAAPDGPGLAFDTVISPLSRLPGTEAQAPIAARAGIALGLDILRMLPKDENQVLSPYSIQVTLAMTRVGARGRTLGEMDAVLRTGDMADFNAAMNAMDQAIRSRAGEFELPLDEAGKTQTVEIGVANSLWGQRRFDFEPDFLDELARSYGAGVNLVDYVTATESARKAINDWVSDQTEERIPELIKPDSLSTDTRLVLTNAVYLKAAWLFPFEPDQTASAFFNLQDGSTTDVEMMNGGLRTTFARTERSSMIWLPYAD